MKEVNCSVCGDILTNPNELIEGICDDCKASIVLNDNIFPNEEDFEIDDIC